MVDQVVSEPPSAQRSTITTEEGPPIKKTPATTKILDVFGRDRGVESLIKGKYPKYARTRR